MNSLVDGLIFMNHLLDFMRQDDINQLPRCDPLVLVRKHLRKDIRRHAFAAFMSKNKLSGPITLMNPAHLHSVGAGEVTHGGIPACFNTLQHRLVILQESHLGGMWQKVLPHLLTRTTNHTQRVASRN